MRFGDRARKLRDEALLVFAAAAVLAILKYESFLERRHKGRGR
jgi:hypothetical protein